MKAIVTEYKTPSQSVLDKVTEMKANVDKANEPFNKDLIYTYINWYEMDFVNKDLKSKIDQVSKEMANKMKGWKEANTDVSYGIHGAGTTMQFWYQKHFEI